MNQNEALQICINNGIKIYPIFQRKNHSTKTKTFKKNNWYIEVDNNGTKTKYEKSLGTGTVLNAVDFEDEIRKTYIHWAKKIN